MYWVKTSTIFKFIFKGLVWSIPAKKNTLFLTFDDGPTPGVTDFVLDILDHYNAKATFFCLGKNIEQHPGIFEDIIQQDHAVGNHTYSHKNGWKTKNKIYYQDVKDFPYPTKLFRPPYGKITLSQYSVLRTQYSIIMWDVLSGDFDPKVSGEQCLTNVLKYAQPGSIIVFHDSVKAREKLKYALPKVLEHFSNKGYEFSAIAEL